MTDLSTRRTEEEQLWARRRSGQCAVNGRLLMASSGDDMVARQVREGTTFCDDISAG